MNLLRFRTAEYSILLRSLGRFFVLALADDQEDRPSLAGNRCNFGFRTTLI